MYKLYKHQQKIVSLDPKKWLLGHGTGSGKTRTALALAKGRTLVICPKTQKEDKNWEREVDKMKLKIDLTVISKEKFRIDYPEVPNCDTLILEECHTVLGATPSTKYVNKQEVPKTSQIFDKINKYIKEVKPERLYLVSATPAPQPMSVWAISQMFGLKWNYYDFRSAFYFEIKRNYHSIWMPKKDNPTQQRLIKALHNFGDFITLQDCFDVPPQIFKVMYVEQTSEQRSLLKKISVDYPDPLVYRTKSYGVDNGIHISTYSEQISDNTEKMHKKTDFIKDNKIDKIKLITDEFDKVLIFAVFRGQIEKIKNELEKYGKKVYVLTGETKDRGKMIHEADNGSTCVFIAQAGISAGYELKSFRTIVWASLSGKWIDYIQGQGRLLRADNLHKNLYINIVTKSGTDEKAYKTIKNGEDFQLKLTGNE